MGSPFSLVVITKNEEQNIGTCLLSVRGLTDDMVVIDNFSTDNTVEIAHSLGARVFSQEWGGYGANKNYGNSLAKYDWILSLDADEFLGAELQSSLKIWKMIEGYAFTIKRINQYSGRWMKHGSFKPEKKIRLFDRRYTSWDDSIVHEKLILVNNQRIQNLHGSLMHLMCDDKNSCLERAQHFARLSAMQWKRDNYKPGVLKKKLSPAFHFIKSFVWQGGFLEGREGWEISLIQREMARWKLMYYHSPGTGQIQS